MKKCLAMALAIMLLAALLPTAAMAATPENPLYWTEYSWENGALKANQVTHVYSHNPVVESNGVTAVYRGNLNSGVYYHDAAKNELDIGSNISVAYSGMDCKLIIPSGKTLIASKIHLQKYATLSIYGGGKLIVGGIERGHDASIDNNEMTLNVHGCTIEVKGKIELDTINVYNGSICMKDANAGNPADIKGATLNMYGGRIDMDTAAGKIRCETVNLYGGNIYGEAAAGVVVNQLGGAISGRKYVVKYYLESEAIGGSDVLVGTQYVVRNGKATPPAAEPGYFYYGWKKNSITGSDWDFSKPVTADLTLIGKKTVNNYTVTLDANGGTIGTAGDTEIPFTQAFNDKMGYYELFDGSWNLNWPSIDLNTAKPVREHYVFNGYYDARSGGKQYITANCTSAANWDKPTNATLYAQWIPETYTVTLDADGGTGGTAEVSAAFGAAMPAITPPQKTGYTFIGYFDDAGKAYYDHNGTSAAAWDKGSGMTLKARWTEEHVITYHMNDAANTIYLTDTALDGAKLTQPVDPTRAGYIFGGWYAENSCTNAFDFTGHTVSGDVDIYARWTADTYTVSFDANGGTGAAAPVTAVYDAAMPGISAIPTRTGYTFAGYHESATGGRQYYNADGSSVSTWNKTTDATLYAHWTANMYTVTLDADGGANGTEAVNAAYQAELPAITVPVRGRDSFLGYFDAPEGGTQYYHANGTAARAWDKAEDGILYAQWSVLPVAVPPVIPQISVPENRLPEYIEPEEVVEDELEVPADGTDRDVAEATEDETL